MIRFYRLLAKIVTVYALLHPFVYLGGQYWEERRILDRVDAFQNKWQEVRSESGLSFKLETDDATPLLEQELIQPSVFSVTNVLFALLTSVGLLGVGALFFVAASVMTIAEARAGGAAPG